MKSWKNKKQCRTGTGNSRSCIGYPGHSHGNYSLYILPRNLFGIIGIVLSLVALSQANRGYGPKTLIIAALICSIVGLTFASVWGFTLSRGGAKVIKEIIREGVPPDAFEDFGRDVRKNPQDMEDDTTARGSFERFGAHDRYAEGT